MVASGAACRGDITGGRGPAGRDGSGAVVCVSPAVPYGVVCGVLGYGEGRDGGFGAVPPYTRGIIAVPSASTIGAAGGSGVSGGRDGE